MINAVEDKNIAALRRLLDNGKHPDSETDVVSKRVANRYRISCPFHFSLNSVLILLFLVL
jgi:hypothetical protein